MPAECVFAAVQRLHVFLKFVPIVDVSGPFFICACWFILMLNRMASAGKLFRVSAGEIEKSKEWRTGLLLGARKRPLPTALEHAILSFVELHDVEALFWSSKAMSDTAAHFLQHALVLRLPRHVSDFAIAVAALHCRHVREVRISGEGAAVRVLPTPLIRLIDNNNHTLRLLDPNLSHRSYVPQVYSALLECPRLEALHMVSCYDWRGNVRAGGLPDAIVAAITPEALPHLRRITLSGVTSYGNIIDILSRG